MKKYCLLLFVMFFFGHVDVYSQESDVSKSPKVIAERQTEKMKELYSLSDAQTKAVYDINFETRSRIVGLETEKMGGEEYLTSKEKLLIDQRKQIAAILDQEQKAKFELDNKRFDEKNVGNTPEFKQKER